LPPNDFVFIVADLDAMSPLMNRQAALKIVNEERTASLLIFSEFATASSASHTLSPRERAGVRA
jgi:hypothetical protein